jgi:hypothetical protein
MFAPTSQGWGCRHIRAPPNAGEEGRLEAVGSKALLDIPGIANERSPFAKQAVPTGTGRIKRMARHHEHFSPLSNGQASRDQRPGAVAGFNDHDPLAEATHDAISSGEVMGTSAHGGGELAHHGAPLENRLGQRAVGSRVNAPMTATEDGQGKPPRHKGCAMSDSINTEGETARDYPAAAGKIAGEAASVPLPEGGHAPGANDR